MPPLQIQLEDYLSKPQYKTVVLFACIYVCLPFLTFRLISFHFSLIYAYLLGMF